MKLYRHQQKFIDRNPNKAMLVWEMQTGKTLAACEWIKKRPHTKILVTCPLAIIKKWERELKKAGVIADVVSTDAVKKINLSNYGGLVLDEAHAYFSPAFTKQRSARTTAIYNYIKNNKNAYILLLTATPIKSQSWNCHTAACFLGKFWPIKKFRDKFFYFTNRFGINHYEPIKNWRKEIRPYLESISDIVLAKDCKEIPKQNHSVIEIPWTKKQEQILKEDSYGDPSQEFHKRHRLEQSDAKWKILENILNGYRKVILVVYYREQIEDYIKRIGDKREVFVLHGGIKDQDSAIEGAKESDDCIFICQASMGAGFSASEFSVMIFSSMSFKYTDYIQSTGRINSLVEDKMHENNYIYLIGGNVDRNVFDTIMLGNDFNPHKYMLSLKNDTRSPGTP